MLRRCSDTSAPPQFFSTIRPTTLPARRSSIHFWTSAIGFSASFDARSFGKTQSCRHVVESHTFSRG